jgi:poly-gamma-glutamate synthesis protein (capsule biosynthesis protein)
LDTPLRDRVITAIEALPQDYQRTQSSADIEIINDPNGSIEALGDTQAQAITSGTIVSTPSKRLDVRSDKLSQANRKKLTEQLTRALKPKSTWTYLALGDVIPARDVYTYSRRHGFDYPYLSVQDRTKSADLTVSNLETTTADNQAFLQGEGVLNFTAPKASLEGVQASGIDGVNLANNHSMNGGATKVAEMIANLTALKIGTFGVGQKGTLATWDTTVQGITIAHLGYDTVPGNIDPTATTPGAQRIPLKPWGTLNQTDIQRVQSEVQAAKAANDIVIPWFHWGTEYTHSANEEQRALAHAAIDAGAEVVIGTHPHWTQGFEWYKGHLIAYSLGNFVFDQNWSEETKRSVALELTFSDKRVTGAKLLPARVENWVQPHFLEATSPVYTQILEDIAEHSWWNVAS